MAKVEIVSRVLKRKSDNTKFEVLIYKPKKDKNNVWVCHFKIGNIEKKAHGEDSMQALIIVIDAIRRILLKNEDQLYWIEGNDFLGFPVFAPMYLQSDKIREIEKMIINIENEMLSDIANKKKKE